MAAGTGVAPIGPRQRSTRVCALDIGGGNFPRAGIRSAGGPPASARCRRRRQENPSAKKRRSKGPTYPAGGGGRWQALTRIFHRRPPQPGWHRLPAGAVRRLAGRNGCDAGLAPARWKLNPSPSRPPGQWPGGTGESFVPPAGYEISGLSACIRVPPWFQLGVPYLGCSPVPIRRPNRFRFPRCAPRVRGKPPPGVWQFPPIYQAPPVG